MEKNGLILKLRETLKENVDEKTLANGQSFFKEKIKFYGVRVFKVTNIGKEFFLYIKDKPKEDIFALCEELWKSGYNEEGYIAANWSYYIHEKYESTDFSIFEKWIDNYITNWGTCDTLCNHAVGAFIEMYPEYIKELKRWAGSENRWKRRAAAVTLIIPARKGLFLNDIFDIADILLTDKDDLVQKGYGWMLKATSEAYQDKVFNYVIQNKAHMPRTSLRYAIEKMPQELRAKAMER